jgi:hypothetical protein
MEKRKHRKTNLVCVSFDFETKKDFTRMTGVFLKSVKAQMPKVNIVSLTDEPKGYYSNKSLYANTLKLRLWNQSVQRLRTDTILSDTDMICLGDITHVFEQDFDIAYTMRTGRTLENSTIPFNLGVMFVKPNKRSRVFFEVFTNVNDAMHTNTGIHSKYESKYAGINQSAFGWMLENWDEPIKLLQLPCSVYNVCDEREWYSISPDAKMVHIKSQLRPDILIHQNTYDRKLIEKWNEYDKR